MKRNLLIYTLSLLIAGVCGSCLQDKDSTATWTPDHVIAVSGISSEGYTLYLGDRFTCEPQITFSDSTRAGDYDYRWIIGKAKSSRARKTSTGRLPCPKATSSTATFPAYWWCATR